MPPRALIVGLAGARLVEDERRFLVEADPWGVILFARNVETPEQLSVLTADVRSALGRNAPILVDQEGGRIQRLRPPQWPLYPSAREISRVHGRDPERGCEAAALTGRLIANDLTRVGISVTCLPVLDLDVPGADQVIGDRAFGGDPAVVATLGQAAAEGVLSGGVLPVIKHLPGHGRALCDSHHALPNVDASVDQLRETDFAPFRALADLPVGMTAHVIYTAFDPDRPATISPRIISEVIRGDIGFGGLLMSDDLSMGALQGPIAARGAAAISAGCDLALHCNGALEEMRALAACLPRLAGLSLARSEAALSRVALPEPIDTSHARARLDALMAA